MSQKTEAIYLNSEFFYGGPLEKSGAGIHFYANSKILEKEQAKKTKLL